MIEALDKKINLMAWARKQHFDFFSGFENPYFNICIQVNTNVLFDYANKNGNSFFLSYLFLAMKAINATAEMRLRIRGEEVWELAKINGSVVQLCEDNTFRFSYINSENDFNLFNNQAKNAEQLAKSQAFYSNEFLQKEGEDNTVHISVLPWLDFTSFSHARHSLCSKGIPKLVFGKYNKITGNMPMSIEVHHGLMDGVHVAQFTAEFQRYLDKPEFHFE